MSTLRFERHDIDTSTSFIHESTVRMKKYAKNWPQARLDLLKPEFRNEILIGYGGSMRSDIEWAKRTGHHWHGRLDIVLINEPVKVKCNLGYEHEHNRQYLVEPGPDGTLVGDVLKLSPKDYEWALRESAACWAVPELRSVILERNR
jgi:uncharacterized protein (DUF952 family)